MKRQDKEIRMRHSGAETVFKAAIITLIALFLTGNTLFIPVQARNPDRVERQEAFFLKQIEKHNAKVLKEQEERRLLEKHIRNERLREFQEQKFIERERRKYYQELERRAQEEKERVEREERVKNLVWGGVEGEYQLYAWSLFPNYGWGEYDLECLIELWRRESRWNPNAHNQSSGAHGIPQSLPASKMASHGSDYYTNPYTQIRWGLDYIAGRYGNPTSALGHSNRTGWY